MPLGIDFSTSKGICRDDAGFYAWVNPIMSSSQTPEGETSVMTLCQNALSGWVSNYQAGNTMKIASQQTYPSEEKILLESFQGETLTTALLHEFTHAPAIVGPNYLSIPSSILLHTLHLGLHLGIFAYCK